jgi:beta-lactamase class A
VGVFARDIESGAEVAYNADDQFPMASTYKVPILVTLYRQAEAGRFSMDDRVPITDADRRLGSGLSMHMRPGLNPTIYDLAMLMITISDNEATDLLLQKVGAENVTSTMRQLGIKDIRVDRQTRDIIRDWLARVDPKYGQEKITEGTENNIEQTSLREKTEAADRAFTDDPRDHASPRGMTDLLTKIVKSQAASEASCHDMLEIMKLQIHTERIPRYLEGVTIASKTGTIGYTTNDTGVIYAGKHHIALTVDTLKQNTSVTTNEVNDRIGQIARVIYDYFQDVNGAN